MRFLGLAVLAAMVIALVGCGTDKGGGPTNMRLRLVNLVPDSALAQLFWKGGAVSPRPLEYREDSGYQSRESGRGKADLFEIDLGTLDSDELFLRTDGEFTLFGVGNITNGTTLLIRVDDDTRPAVDQQKIRIFHGAAPAPAVDVYITAPNVDIEDVLPIFRAVSYTEATPYKNMPPGTFRVRFTIAGTKDVALDTGTQEGNAGQVFTVCAVGDPSVGQPLRTLVVTDRR